MSHRKGRRGPTASSAELFGEELRFARERAGMRQEDLSRLLHCDRTVITRVESGQRRLQPDMVESADELLCSNGLLVRLYDRVDWNAKFEHPNWFQQYADMEAEAIAVRVFQCNVIHGLLQCRDYARAVFEAGDAAGNRRVIAERTAARLGRQTRFLAPDGPFLLAILDESAIHTAFGGPKVMRRQMEHLLEVSKLPNVLIQIAPFANRRTIIDKSMVLLELPEGAHWVYSESLDRGHPTGDPETVSAHRRIYDRIRGEVLSVDDSLALIVDVLEGFRDDEERARRDGVAQEQPQRRQRRRLHRGGPRLHRPRPGA
ncbi:helix-turn-helix domain-containing protein [Kitasatospora sp. NPDC004240]